MTDQVKVIIIAGTEEQIKSLLLLTQQENLKKTKEKKFRHKNPRSPQEPRKLLTEEERKQRARARGITHHEKLRRTQ